MLRVNKTTWTDRQRQIARRLPTEGFHWDRFPNFTLQRRSERILSNLSPLSVAVCITLAYTIAAAEHGPVILYCALGWLLLILLEFEPLLVQPDEVEPVWVSAFLELPD